ncbi:helix-turn-helix domain-containing protein [Bergeyella sp. RCAD1439]|uniref:helix-turn-helix domain-containing protein n=1 Tax=Bergeyella anatis TaxID=3113737 RepID=UPI002E1958F9|nr:helix-turn-helix transcriptional regulator [Bergeyella sp. RCAD1439]
MKINLKFDFNAICRKVLEEQLAAMGVNHRVLAFGEVELLEKLPKESYSELKERLQAYGIDIIEDQKTALVQKIKDVIAKMVFSEESIQVKASVYLAEQLGHSYGYISNVFSQVTYTSIENYIILQKIEYAKQLLIIENLSLTDIAHRLSYSSVAHLSTQFKNTTGMTPSQFQKIIAKRRVQAIKN